MFGQTASLFKKSVAKIEAVLSMVGMGLLFVLMVLGSCDVIGRYIFNNPVPGTLEASKLMLTAMVMLGLASTQADKVNVSVRVFTDRMPARLRAAAGFLTSLLSLFLFVIITWQAAVIAVDWWGMNRFIPILHIPTAVGQIVVCVGGLLMCLQMIIDLAALVPAIRKA